MQVRHLDANVADLFMTYSPGKPLTACFGAAEGSGQPLRLPFEEIDRANLMIVGRSPEAALGICTAMLFDLARQIITTPRRREIYTTPPFSILDFLGTEEARVFTNAAMSLPLAVKLERATDTAMTTLTDLQFELTRRRREPLSPRHSKFLFLCGLQAAHGIRSQGSYAPSEINPHALKFTGFLRGGTTQSLHAVVWCNSFANIDLTMPDGIDWFDHVVVLNGAGPIPANICDGPVESDGRARYIDRRYGTIAPFIPFGVPTESWCDAVIRTFDMN